jgi:hypothetical protein
VIKKGFGMAPWEVRPRSDRANYAGRIARGLVLLYAVAACTPMTQDAAGGGGMLHLADGSTIPFDDLLSLSVTLPSPDGQPVSRDAEEWIGPYSPTSPARFVPLNWVESIEVVTYEVDADCPCLRDVVLSIRTVNGVEFLTRTLATLEQVQVRIVDGEIDGGMVLDVPFVDGAGLHVRRLVVTD